MPRTEAEELEIMRGFFAINNFPRVIGAIDGTHIPIRNPGGPLAQIYINRKGWYSINTQVVVDHLGKVCDVVARWRGSAHDARIFNECILKQRFENNEFRGLLIGDSGFGCTPYLLTPVLNPATRQEERYNRAHILTRNIIERSFGRFKKKFLCLFQKLNTNLETAKAVIVACCVLHNLSIEWNGFEDEDHDDDDNIRRLEQPARLMPQQNRRGIVFRQQFIRRHF
jgi:hypothetical protein